MFDATRQDAINATISIYADFGHTAGADEFNDMDNRIRDGQTLAELVANTYDTAKSRFVGGGHDAQAEIGRTFDPPAVMLEQLAAPSREQAPMMNSSPAVSLLRSTPSNTPRYNVGPAPGAYSGTVSGGGVLGGSIGTILMLGGAVIVAIVLFKKMGTR